MDGVVEFWLHVRLKLVQMLNMSVGYLMQHLTKKQNQRHVLNLFFLFSLLPVVDVNVASETSPFASIFLFLSFVLCDTSVVVSNIE